MIARVYFILYVRDQDKSTAFYSRVLNQQPRLHVPGMTEFVLCNGCVLGLMPEAGIKKLLGKRLPDPSRATGVPRSELYLIVEDPQAYHKRALELGALELSELKERDWGHRVAYSLDPDGHVMAFAEEISHATVHN